MHAEQQEGPQAWAPPPRSQSLIAPEPPLKPPPQLATTSTGRPLPPAPIAEPTSWPAGAANAFVPVSGGELRDEGGWDEVREVLQDAERSGAARGAQLLPLPLPAPPAARFAQLKDDQKERLGRSTSLRVPSSQLDIPEATPRRLSNPLPPAASLAFDPWAPPNRSGPPLRTSSLASNASLAAPFVPATTSTPRTAQQQSTTFPARTFINGTPPFDPYGAGFTPPPHIGLSAPSSPLFPGRQSFAPNLYDPSPDFDDSGGQKTLTRYSAGATSALAEHHHVENERAAGQLGRSASLGNNRRRAGSLVGPARFGAGTQQPPPPSNLSFAASRPQHRGPPPPLYHLPPTQQRSLPPRLVNPPFTPPATATAQSFSLAQRTSTPQLRSGLTERTSFAMWVGNVPPDATEAELWAFFLSRPPLPNSQGAPGLQSVRLIARSQCAFVNLSSEAHLQHTITQSHGILLRPDDPKCKPLVCRVRRVEDDAKSGVGAQRGGGLHKAWVELHNQEEVKRKSLELGVEVEEVRKEMGSADTTSTDSDFFEAHFPKRFFILKSHNQFDLEQSAKTGWWATQPHNEAVLDQAFRTAHDGVYLIFSANKSGSWAGFAKMTGPIFPPDEHPPKGSTISLPRPHAGKMAFETSPAPRRPFRVHWLSTTGVSFSRTRHLFNSFNAGREVKICRDGTEVEPRAGELLVEELARAVVQPARVPIQPLPPAPNVGLGFPSLPTATAPASLYSTHDQLTH